MGGFSGGFSDSGRMSPDNKGRRWPKYKQKARVRRAGLAARYLGVGLESLNEEAIQIPHRFFSKDRDAALADLLPPNTAAALAHAENRKTARKPARRGR